jgi:O-antigen/teichoic acid export membrane protein
MVEQVLQEVRIGARRLVHGALRRPFVRHVGILTIANGVGAVLSVVQGILVARWLGPELYGVVALVTSIPDWVYTFFDARVSEALIKYLSEFDARGDRTRAAALSRLGYLIDFAVATMAFLGILVIAPWASRAVVHRPELVWLLVIYAVAFLPRSLRGTSYVVLAVHHFFYTIALIETTVTIVRVGLVLGLILAGWGVPGVVWGNAVALALSGLLYAIAARPLLRSSWGNVPWLSTWGVLKGYRREFIGFIAYTNLNVLLASVPKQLDILLLGYLHGPKETGYYKLAKSIGSLTGYLAGPLSSVVYPDLARLWALQDYFILKHRVYSLLRRVGLPLGYLTLVSAFLVPFFIPIMFGNVYMPAIPLIVMFLSSGSMSLFLFWLKPLCLAMGEIPRWTRMTAFLSFSFVLLALPGAYILGALGLSLAFLLSHGISSILLTTYILGRLRGYEVHRDF